MHVSRALSNSHLILPRKRAWSSTRLLRPTCTHSRTFLPSTLMSHVPTRLLLASKSLAPIDLDSLALMSLQFTLYLSSTWTSIRFKNALQLGNPYAYDSKKHLFFVHHIVNHSFMFLSTSDRSPNARIFTWRPDTFVGSTYPNTFVGCTLPDIPFRLFRLFFSAFLLALVLALGIVLIDPHSSPADALVCYCAIHFFFVISQAC